MWAQGVCDMDTSFLGVTCSAELFGDALDGQDEHHRARKVRNLICQFLKIGILSAYYAHDACGKSLHDLVVIGGYLRKLRVHL
jgi:hypothetical protein